MSAKQLLWQGSRSRRSAVAAERRGWVHVQGPVLMQVLRVVDAACIVASLWASTRLFDLSWSYERLLLGLLGAACFVQLASGVVLYRSWRVSSISSELVLVVTCCVGAVLLVTVPLSVLDMGPAWAREPIVAWCAFACAAMVCGRLLVRLALRSWRARGRNFRTAAIVGATGTAERLIRELDQNRWMGIRVAGVFDEEGEGREHRLPVAGDFEQLRQVIREGQIDTVYVTLPLGEEHTIHQVVQGLRDSTVSVCFLADFSGYGLLRPCWQVLGGTPAFSLVDTPHVGANALLKRGFDILLACLALLALSIPMLVLAAAVKLTSPGAVIFAQKRYGLGGKGFRIYKFRTMYMVEDGETDFTFTQASRGDCRISPIGAFLRRTSLDELPQLFNVLRGDMSLVGPRPHPVALNETQRKLIDGYMLRHKVKPGMTGWAQVHGCRGETDTLEKMRRRVDFDLQYINDWSLWLDIKILCRTMLVVFHDPNAF